MEAERFDDLLKRMPKIAEAANAFKSELVQKAAFDALLATLGFEARTSGPQVQPRHRKSARGRAKSKRDGEDRETESTKAKTANPRRAKARKTSFSIVNDLNLRPKNKQNLKDFAAEKGPASHIDKCTVSVYYLINTADIEEVTMDHVFTCYKHMSWRLPSDLSNMLAQAGTQGYLDVTDRTNIRLTTHGENLVEHDLPKKGRESE